MTRIRTGHRQNGFILVVVLGAVLVLSSLLFGFNLTARTRLNSADSFYRTEQIGAAARAGIEIAIAVVRDANDFGADPRFFAFLNEGHSFLINDANCSVTISDESGRLNINHLKTPDGQLNRPVIDQFLRLIDLVNAQQDGGERIGYGVVPSLIDWIDPDEEVTRLPFIQRDNTGAEEDYYRALPRPYGCRNRPLDTVEDLRWIRGVTPEAFHRLRPYLTCFGDGRINVNTAPKLVLQSLSEQMDGAVAQMILNQRRLKPFENVAQLRALPGMTDNLYRTIKDRICVRPQERFYRVLSRANLADRSRAAEALLRRNPQAGTVDMVLYREQ
ncbi:MAG TPA: type II secretion system minor pseudopilin GspK [Sedimentisphaerales bacterium]|nr:type II secretion system minor pseudopilin GspK [Sedimentisphaerales bacterium]